MISRGEAPRTRSDAMAKRRPSPAPADSMIVRMAMTLVAA